MAYWLRDLRRRTGLTYTQLARKTNYSVSTLQEAAAGRRLPTAQVTLAIVDACNGDMESWRTYWQQIRRQIEEGTASEPGVAVPPPWAAEDSEDFDKDPEFSGATDNLPTSKLPPGRRAFAKPNPKLLLWSLLAIAAVVVVLVTLIITNAPAVLHSPFPSPDKHPPAPKVRDAAQTYKEQEFNPNGAPTFLHLDGSGAGTPIAYGQYVQVSCKVHSTIFQSTKPNGYWYRLASMPWDNHYYAVANTFGNGDRLGSPPYRHNTDWKVPNC